MALAAVDSATNILWHQMLMLFYVPAYVDFLRSLTVNQPMVALNKNFFVLPSDVIKGGRIPYNTEIEGHYVTGFTRTLEIFSYGTQVKLDRNLERSMAVSKVSGILDLIAQSLVAQQAQIAVMAFMDDVKLNIEKPSATTPSLVRVSAVDDGVITIPPPTGFAADDLGLNKARLMSLYKTHSKFNLKQSLDRGSGVFMPQNHIALKQEDFGSLVEQDLAITSDLTQRAYKNFHSDDDRYFFNYKINTVPYSEADPNPLDYDSVIVNDSGTDYRIRYIYAYTADALARGFDHAEPIIADRSGKDPYVNKYTSKVKYGAMRLKGKKVVRLGIKEIYDPTTSTFMNSYGEYVNADKPFYKFDSMDAYMDYFHDGFKIKDNTTPGYIRDNIDIPTALPIASENSDEQTDLNQYLKNKKMNNR